MNDTICQNCGSNLVPGQAYCPNCGLRVKGGTDAGKVLARVLLILISVFVALPLAIMGGGCLVMGVASLNGEGLLIAVIGLAALAGAIAILYATVTAFRR